MGHHDKMINGLEVDAILARKLYCYLQNNSSLVKFAKRSINKRSRSKAKNEINLLTSFNI
jgi:hypothetical protein